MKFEIIAYISPEGEETEFGINDLDDLEAFIKANLRGRKYGGEPQKFYWGFNLFEYKGLFEKFVEKAEPSWNKQRKELVSHSHMQWKKFAKLSKLQALRLIKKECLLAIERLAELKKGPKGFNVALFHSEMKQVFDYYIQHL